MQALDADGQPTGEVTDLGQADADGMLALPKTSGDVRLTAHFGQDAWEAMKPTGSTDKDYNYRIQIIPDKESFAASVEGADGAQRLLNLGTGGEPGMGKPATESTEDKQLNSSKGYPFANNDWSKAWITAVSNIGGPGVKALFRPWTEGQTVFEEGNRDFAKAASEVEADHSVEGRDTVSKGAQIHVYLAVNGDRDVTTIPKAGTSLDLYDVWAPGTQTYRGGFQVVLQPKDAPASQYTVVDPSQYTVYYTRDEATPAKNVCEIAGRPGPVMTALSWIEGEPPVGDDSVRGIRVELHDVDDYQRGTGAPRIAPSFYVTAGEPVREDQDSYGDGKVTDYLTQTWTNDADQMADYCASANVTVTKPRAVSAAIAMDLQLISPDGEVRSGTGVPGDTATYTVLDQTLQGRTDIAEQHLYVDNVTLSGTKLTPVITIPLPNGLIEPRSLSSEWVMTLEQVDSKPVMRFTYNSADGTVAPPVSARGRATLPPLQWSATVGNAAAGFISAAATLDVDAAANQGAEGSSAVSNASAQTFAVSDDWIQGAVLAPVTPLVEITDPVAFHFDINARGTGRNGTMTTVLRMPASGSDAPSTGDDRAMRGEGCTPVDSQTAEGCQGLDGTWNQYDGGYSSYHGGSWMSKPIALESGNSTDTQVLYAVDNVYSEDPGDFTWYTWDELTQKFGSTPNVTAVQLTSTFENPNLEEPTLGVASAVGTVTLDIDPDDVNHAGDKYVMWLGKARYTQELPQDAAQPTVPFPAEAKIVDSSIEGTVWWDQNRNTVIDGSPSENPGEDPAEPEATPDVEDRIQGIEVTLWRTDLAGNKLDAEPLRTAHTDKLGHYKFGELHSGQYLVEVKRNDGTETKDGVQTETITYYNGRPSVERTRSWKKTGDQSADSSGLIQLAISDKITKVDFGYVKPDPRVTLNKTQQAFSCTDAMCKVSWDVVVENKGNTPIPVGSETLLHDRTSSNVVFENGTIGTETEDIPGKITFEQIDAGYNHTLALDNEGRIWAWGDNSRYEAGTAYKTTQTITNKSGKTFQAPVEYSAVPERLKITDSDGSEVFFTFIEAGEHHSFAIDKQGRLWGWGDNRYGRVKPALVDKTIDTGDMTGSFAPVTTPTIIPVGQPDGSGTVADPKTVVYVSSNYSTTVAIDSDGHLWSWGWGWANAEGRKIGGSGTAIMGQVMAVPAGAKFVKVATGDRHTLAMTQDGYLYNFGFNGFGELGGARQINGNGEARQVTRDGTANGTPVVAQDIAAGDRAEYYIDKETHTVYAAGSNYYGQLGLGYLDTDIRSDTKGSGTAVSKRGYGPFTQVPGLSDVQKIVAGDATVLAMTGNGTLYGWGSNRFGQLGTASNAQPNVLNSWKTVAVQTTPTVVYTGAATNKDATYGEKTLTVSANTTDITNSVYRYSVCRRTDSNANNNDDCGDGGASIADGNEGETTTLVLLADGTLLGMGANGSGQIGNGDSARIAGHTTATAAADVSSPAPVAAVIPPTDPKEDPTSQSITPTTEVNEGSDVLRTYEVTLPQPINPGGRIVLHVSGKVVRTSEDQKIHNQAWFESPDTPYAQAPNPNATTEWAKNNWQGVPSLRGVNGGTTTAITSPSAPNDDNLQATLDITGNVTKNTAGSYNLCLTGTDKQLASDGTEGAVVGTVKEHSFAARLEDSCDEVGNIVPRYTTSSKPVLGSISGYVWRDNAKAGLRPWIELGSHGESGNQADPSSKDVTDNPPIKGVKVYLLDKSGNPVPGGVTTTDENGYYEFTNLEVGTDEAPAEYGVRFEPVYRSEFTTTDVKSGTDAAQIKADTDGSSQVNSDAISDSASPQYGQSTAWASLTSTKQHKPHLDAGVLPEKPWLRVMPSAGLGLWVLVALGVGLTGLAGSAYLLRRASKQS